MINIDKLKKEEIREAFEYLNTQIKNSSKLCEAIKQAIVDIEESSNEAQLKNNILLKKADDLIKDMKESTEEDEINDQIEYYNMRDQFYKIDD